MELQAGPRERVASMTIRKILSTGVILALIFLSTSTLAWAYQYEFQKSPGITVDVLHELEFLEQFGDNSDIPRTDARVIALARELYRPLSERGDHEAEAPKDVGYDGCGEYEEGLLFAALQNPAISDSTRAQVDSIIADSIPALNKTYTKGAFKFFSTTTSADSRDNVTLAEIKATAKYLNKYWKKYSRTFTTPKYYVSGGKRRIDVKCYYLSSTLYGSTSSFWDYINLNSKLVIKDPCKRRTTSAHELFHRVQYSYGYVSGMTNMRWIVEGTASWSQRFTNKTIWDYMGQMNTGLDSPDRDLISARSYDACHLWVYLHKRKGWMAIRSTWRKYKKNGKNAKAALNSVVRGFDRFIQYWVKANYIKDLKNAGKLYRYNENKTRKKNRCGITYGPLNKVPRTKKTISSSTSWSTTGYVRPYGADYYEFKLNRKLTKLRINVEGKGQKSNFSYHFIGIKNKKWKKIKNATKKKKYTFTKSLKPGQWDKVALVVAGRSKGGVYEVKIGSGSDAARRSTDILVGTAGTAGIAGSKAVKILKKNFPKGIKGMAYQPAPTDYFVPGTPAKYGNTDFWNSDFEALWNPKGDGKGVVRTVHFPDGTPNKKQGDLQTLKDMGVNLIRLYNWQSGNNNGKTPWVDHQPFLDKCDRLGIKVIVPVFITASPTFKTDVEFKNITWLIKTTARHSSVVFYSIGNENTPGGDPVAFKNIGIAAEQVRKLIGAGGKQLIISPMSFGKSHIAFFTKRKFKIDVWAFNVFDPNDVQTAVGWVGSNKLVDGQPLFFSEFGVSAYDVTTSKQKPQRQVTNVPLMMDIIYQNVAKIWGGVWFEFSDERYKGLQKKAKGGARDKTKPASTYVSQIGGSVKTYKGGPLEKVPRTSGGKRVIGNCTQTWVAGGWPTLSGGTLTMSEGYFGMGLLRNTGKTALTTRNGKSVNYQLKPWIYRVDDLFLRDVYKTLKDQWKK